MTEVLEVDGPRGGKYFVVRLSGGREVSISRNPGDDRVWEGPPYEGQRGGVGRLDDLIEEYRSRLAADPAARERYFALRALAARKESR